MLSKTKLRYRQLSHRIPFIVLLMQKVSYKTVNLKQGAHLPQTHPEFTSKISFLPGQSQTIFGKIMQTFI